MAYRVAFLIEHDLANNLSFVFSASLLGLSNSLSPDRITDVAITSVLGNDFTQKDLFVLTLLLLVFKLLANLLIYWIWVHDHNQCICVCFLMNIFTL